MVKYAQTTLWTPSSNDVHIQQPDKLPSSFVMHSSNDMLNKQLNVIDLFSGCGGLSYGFSKAGYEVVLGIDNWKDALDTFAANHLGSKVFISDLYTEAPENILSSSHIHPEEIDIIIGGPPCQGFSISGKRDV